MQVYVAEEQLLAVELHAVGDTDVADVPTGSRGLNRLHHRLLCADTLEHRVSANSIGELLDASDSLIASLAYDVSGPELASQLLSGLVTTHRDDAPGAQLLGGQHAEETDGTIADDLDRRSPLHVCRAG